MILCEKEWNGATEDPIISADQWTKALILTKFQAITILP